MAIQVPNPVVDGKTATNHSKGRSKNAKPVTNKKRGPATDSKGAQAKFPRHAVDKALRIPKAILEQNGGKECTDREAAGFAKIGFGGPVRVELSSALKYGFLDRPRAGSVRLTDLGRKVLPSQNAGDDLAGLREAVLHAPDFSEVYNHYRGEHLPDRTFFENALVDKFGVPKEKVSEFTELFTASLQAAKLIEGTNGKSHIIDVSKDADGGQENTGRIKQLTRDVSIKTGDSCFVMMPFASPIGDYYAAMYEPAIRKAGLIPVRADAEIFATGKIMEQVWSGIRAAKVLVAELTERNPNVFYELGLAHALQKPVVLISSNENDVPFDLKHIRVIYYNMTDPFWGAKLLDKVAENILSALKNPDEAVFARAVKDAG